MEVTKFVVSGREKAKLFGDYATYRKQLSSRIHNLRRKLGIATKPRAKYTQKATVTAEDIGGNHEYLQLLLLTSERAWANAMSMREVHSADTKGITGSSRSHIISRLHKASTHANDIFQLLINQTYSGATVEDILEARAYAASLTGAREFEKQSWEACVKSYSEARIIYSALSTSTKSDVFRDLLTDPIDPSIRYGAYQMRVPRTIAIPAIARKFFPRSDSELVLQVETLDADVLSEQPKSKTTSTEPGAAPKSITWRSRTVVLEDAAIATALASVNDEASKLSEALAPSATSQPRDRASAYDDILISSQDAVDATKHAIDELSAEGVGQDDKRIQSLQITRTAVTYDLISWRIGRNRVLAGERDGALLDNTQLKSSRKRKKDDSIKEEATGRRLAQLREKVALYDSILQSLESIRELPGVAADSGLLEDLEAKYAYFSALKCLTIARSHTLLSNLKNALALLARALEKCTSAHEHLSSAMDTSSSTPPNLSISPAEVQLLQDLLSNEVQRYRALVELSNLNEAAHESEEGANRMPLVERLNEYPTKDVDLLNLVQWPPKLEPVPVKPLFFDAAWNYIDYPGREVEQEPASGAKEGGSKGGKDQTPPPQQQQQKKGWFGFGR